MTTYHDHIARRPEVAVADMEIKASEFKARCLRLLDDVARTKRTIVVTKRGKPVAKLVPMSAKIERPSMPRVTILTDRIEDLYGIPEAWGDPPR